MKSFAPSAFFASVAAFSSLAAWSPVALGATDEERAGARAAASAGYQACEAKDYALCVEKFSKAESIIHSPVHLMYLGRAHLALGHYVEAREAYLKISREGAPDNAPDAVKTAVAEANAKLPEIEPHIANATVNVTGADGKEVELFVDGKPISAALIGISRPVNPGRHEITAKAPGMKADPVVLEINAGESKDVTVTLVIDPNAPKDEPKGGTVIVKEAPGADPVLLWSGVGALGIGAAGAVVGLVFGLDSKNKADQVKELCGGDANNCAVNAGSAQERQINDLNSKAGDSFTMEVIGFGVGGVGLLAGAALIYFSLPKSEAPQEAAFTLTPVIGPRYAGVRGTF